MPRYLKIQEFVAHAGNVNCVEIGRKSSGVLVTGGDDKKVNLWTIGTQAKSLSLPGHQTPVDSVTFDHVEEVVAAGASSGSIKLFDLDQAKVTRALTGHRSNVLSLELNAFGLVSGSMDTNVKLWDLRRKDAIQTCKGHKAGVTHVRFSPDGKWVASGSSGGEVKIFDTVAGKVIQEFTQHTHAITGLEFHPYEYLLATSSADKTVKLWDLETMQMLDSTPPEATGVRALAFHPEGRHVFSALQDGLKVWSWEPSPMTAHDNVDVPWSKVADVSMLRDKNKLVGCSFHQSFVGLWVVDLKDVKPFGGEGAGEKDEPVIAARRSGSNGARDVSTSGPSVFQDLALRRQGSNSAAAYAAAAPVAAAPGARGGVQLPAVASEPSLARGMRDLDIGAGERRASGALAAARGVSSSADGEPAAVYRGIGALGSSSTPPRDRYGSNAGRSAAQQTSAGAGAGPGPGLPNSSSSGSLTGGYGPGSRHASAGVGTDPYQQPQPSAPAAPAPPRPGMVSIAVGVGDSLFKGQVEPGALHALAQQGAREQEHPRWQPQQPAAPAPAPLPPRRSQTGGSQADAALTAQPPLRASGAGGGGGGAAAGGMSDAAAIAAVLAGHDQLRDALNLRYTAVSVSRAFLTKGDLRGALQALRRGASAAAAASSSDAAAAAAADVLGAALLLPRFSDMLRLEHVPDVVPLLEGVVSLPAQGQVKVGLDVLSMIMAGFGPTIREVASAPALRGVDLQGDLRRERCSTARMALQGIATKLGHVGRKWEGKDDVARRAHELIMQLQEL